MAGNERLYIVTYDIADPKRWRQVFRAMEGSGSFSSHYYQ
jgi:CRISPR-associated protein Cas2